MVGPIFHECPLSVESEQPQDVSVTTIVEWGGAVGAMKTLHF